MPPEMMRKLRAAGPQGAQKMLQDMMGGAGGAGAGGPGGMDMGSMMRRMMGGGGGGGMPDMAQMQGEWARRSAKERNGARSAEWE
jgi:signal recognition particle subunit SRP54